MCIPCDKTQNFDALTLTFVPLLKKLNLGRNFWTKRDGTFILGKDIPYGKTCLYHNFLSSDIDLQLWPTFERT